VRSLRRVFSHRREASEACAAAAPLIGTCAALFLVLIGFFVAFKKKKGFLVFCFSPLTKGLPIAK
jgi:hypothetical protein